MARIRIDIDTLRSRAASLQSHIVEYEALNSGMENLSEGIVAGWKGESSQVYGELMTSYVSKARSLTEIIKQFENYARTTADKFESLDASCAARIRNSF